MGLKTWKRSREMRWLQHLHHQPHELPPQCPPAGAQWSPDIEPYDRYAPAFPYEFPEEEIKAQEEAGAKLRDDIWNAERDGRKDFEIPPGVYRLKEPIVIENTEDFSLYCRDVELLVTEPIVHFRILGNKNLKVFGPMTLDSAVLPLTQGDIIAVNEEEMTIDVQIWDGYEMTDKAERIQIFTEQGVMLPHCQDCPQSFDDLGNRQIRLKMNGFTWPQHSPHAAAEILKVGNFLAMEIGGRGGLEMRDNTNTLWEDITQCSHSLAWAMPEYGDDVFLRWKGSRRRGTNRLAGGGYPLMTFYGGAYILMDSEIGHNFDDLTDINTAQTFAFHQVSPNQFYAADEWVTGHETTDLEIYDYKTMEMVASCKIVETTQVEDQDAAKQEFKDLAAKYNIVPKDSAILIITIDQDIENLPELNYVSLPQAVCREMRFERNYLHDGLAAGISGKGAHSIIIKDNIVERAAGSGICCGFDPFWWEGNPSRNIEITGNTIRNASYVSSIGGPGISVYVGGSWDGNPGPDGIGRVQRNILIANNAIYTVCGPGIIVANSEDIEIRENVITDCGCSRKEKGSIYLDAVSEGTKVFGNVFVGWDASDQNVQIKTSQKTRSSFIHCAGNMCSNPEVPVPGMAWEYTTAQDDSVEFHGEGWHDADVYPHLHKESFEKDALCLFHFEGSRVRILGGQAKWMGLSDVWIDDNYIGTFDGSRPGDVVINPHFMSPVLPEGSHLLKIMNKAEAGKDSTEDNKGLSISGFDVLPNGSGVCLS